MKLNNLLDIASFCTFLKMRKVTYSLHHYSDDGITVMLSLVGVRIEVEFGASDVSYSVFRGHEDVELDVEALIKMIIDYTE